MSRSGYSSDLDPLVLGRWRAQVASAIRGKRGQKLLADMVAALEAMPEKRLIASSLEESGEVCALGAVGRMRGINMMGIDPTEPEEVADAFNIARQLAMEIAFENDEACPRDTPEERWQSMRNWAVVNIRPAELEKILWPKSEGIK